MVVVSELEDKVMIGVEEKEGKGLQKKMTATLLCTREQLVSGMCSCLEHEREICGSRWGVRMTVERNLIISPQIGQSKERKTVLEQILKLHKFLFEC